MTSQSSATSTGEPRKFCSGRGVRFQTKTWSPLLAQRAGDARPDDPEADQADVFVFRACHILRRVDERQRGQGQFDSAGPQWANARALPFQLERGDGCGALLVFEQRDDFGARFFQAQLTRRSRFRQAKNVEAEPAADRAR